VYGTVTGPTKWDQIPSGFTSEAFVGTVMEIVTERPIDAANEAVRLGPVALDPVRRPSLSECKPLLAGHVVAIGSPAMNATH
jgi:hypothetical protein